MDMRWHVGDRLQALFSVVLLVAVIIMLNHRSPIQQCSRQISYEAAGSVCYTFLEEGWYGAPVPAQVMLLVFDPNVAGATRYNIPPEVLDCEAFMLSRPLRDVQWNCVYVAQRDNPALDWIFRKKNGKWQARMACGAPVPDRARGVVKYISGIASFQASRVRIKSNIIFSRFIH